MKKVLFLSFIFLYKLINAQIGVGTQTPQKTLHVNGNLQITNELNVGGDSSTSGNSGEYGSYLISNGTNVAPSWQNLASLGVQKLVNVSLTTSSSSGSANVFSTIKYNSNPYIDNKYVTYNSSNSSYTILVAGYYSFSGYTNLSLTGDGTITYYIRNGTSNIFLKNTNFSSSVASSGINVSGTIYLDANSIITQVIAFTRSFTINNGSFSITYLGNGE